MAIYKGTEVKFGINLTAQGFDMDADDFDIQIVSKRVTISGSKGNPDPESKIRIFKDDGEWFVIAETDTLSTDQLKVVVTAYIPDANAADGVRKEIAVANLDTLINP